MRCFRVLGQRKKYAHLGDCIRVSVKEAKAKILRAKVKKTASDVAKNPLEVRTLRRDVARMLTVVRERQQEKK